MRDVILVICVAATFAFGWFLMKRLDDFLAHNAREIQEDAQSRENILRIAVSNPMTAHKISNNNLEIKHGKRYNDKS